jgi:hypothetical protein
VHLRCDRNEQDPAPGQYAEIKWQTILQHRTRQHQGAQRIRDDLTETHQSLAGPHGASMINESVENSAEPITMGASPDLVRMKAVDRIFYTLSRASNPWRAAVDNERRSTLEN